MSKQPSDAAVADVTEQPAITCDRESSTDTGETEPSSALMTESATKVQTEPAAENKMDPATADKT
jgi:hypothetical protein